MTGVYWAAWKFTEHRSSGSALNSSKHKAFALVGSAILVQTALMRVGFTFGDSLAARMHAPFNDPIIWNFAIPFAAAALLVAMLVDTQLAFLTGIITALFAGMIAPGDAKGVIRHDLMFRGNLWYRTLSRAAVGNAGWIIRRRRKRSHGACFNRLRGTTVNPEDVFAGGRVLDLQVDY